MKFSRFFVVLMAIVMIVTTIPTAVADDAHRIATIDLVYTTRDTPLLDILTGESLCSIPAGAYFYNCGVVGNYQLVKYNGFPGLISLSDVNLKMKVEIPMLIPYQLKQDAEFSTLTKKTMYILDEGTTVNVIGPVCRLWSFVVYDGTFGLIPNDCLDGFDYNDYNLVSDNDCGTT